MSISSDVQKLEPGKRVRLIEVDGSAFGAGILRFHNETIPHTEAEIIAAGGDESKLEPKSVWWQGQEYGAWPYELTAYLSAVTARVHGRHSLLQTSAVRLARCAEDFRGWLKLR